MRNLFSAIALFMVSATIGTSPASSQLFGVGKFKIEQTDDRFSTDGLTTYSGMNNRISKKSVAGGVHIDSKGMFVEPFAIKNKASGTLIGLSLFIHNETDFDTSYGAPNSIGVPQRITFLPDNVRRLLWPSETASKIGARWRLTAVSRAPRQHALPKVGLPT